MMQLAFDLSIPLIILVFVWVIITLAMYKKSPVVRMSNIVMGLLALVVVTFAVAIYIMASVAGTGGVVIGTDDLPYIIVAVVFVVGIISFFIYDKILRSRLGYSARKLMRG